MSKKIQFPTLFVMIATAGIYVDLNFLQNSARSTQAYDWLWSTTSRPDLMMSARTRRNNAHSFSGWQVDRLYLGRFIPIRRVSYLSDS